jgi:multiple sugar transport system ATP-binding protein
MFVGGFIGTPAMNFLTGEVKDDGYFYCENLKLQIPEPKFALLKEKDYLNRQVVLGIRPEDIHDELVALETYKTSSANFLVDVAELLGAETNIHISIGNTNIIAKVNARSDVHIGDHINLALNMNKCHFFDVDNEQKITKSSPVKSDVAQ